MAIPTVTVQTSQAVLRYPDGSLITGTVYFSLSARVVIDDAATATIQHRVQPTTISQAVTSGVFDAAVSLVPNVDTTHNISPADTTYAVKLVGDKGTWVEKVQIDWADGATQEFGDIARV